MLLLLLLLKWQVVSGSQRPEQVLTSKTQQERNKVKNRDERRDRAGGNEEYASMRNRTY